MPCSPHSPISPTSSRRGSAAIPAGSRRSPRTAADTPDSTMPRATVCGGRVSFTTSAGSASRTGSGTSRARSRPRSGSGCGFTRTTQSGSLPAAVRSRPSSSRRRRTTSAWTDPAITARSLPRRCRGGSDSGRGGRLRRAHRRPAVPRGVRATTRPPACSRPRPKAARRGRGRLRARRSRQRAVPSPRVAGRAHRPGGGGAAPARSRQDEPGGGRALFISAKTVGRHVENLYAEDRSLDARRRRPLRDGARAPRLTTARNGVFTRCGHRGR